MICRQLDAHVEIGPLKLDSYKCDWAVALTLLVVAILASSYGGITLPLIGSLSPSAIQGAAFVYCLSMFICLCKK